MIVALALVSACAAESAPTPDAGEPSNAETGGKADRFDDFREATLLSETHLEDILEHPDTARFEASGVAVRGDRILIVFDNLRRFASIDAQTLADARWLGDNDYGVEDDSLVEDSDDFAGFEGIAVEPDSQRVALAIEGMRTEGDDIWPGIVHWDEESSEFEWLAWDLEAVNKGIEGLGFVDIDGERFLAALCESGKCDDRSRGRLLLRGADGDLTRVDLPKGLDFEDFSGLAIRGQRIAVVSQESSMLWIGSVFRDADGELDTETEDLLRLPRQRDGDVDFCTVEGIDWLDDTTLVAVSDLEKRGQPGRCEDHAERIHFLSIE